MKKTNLKKILSCIMAASMLPAVVTSVSAKPISKTETLLSQDFETLGEGFSLDTALTDEQLAQLGFTLTATDSAQPQLPKATIKQITYKDNDKNKDITSKLLCLEIDKGDDFTLKKNLGISLPEGTKNVNAEFTFLIIDDAKWKDNHETNRVGFESFGLMNDKQGTAIVYPKLNRGLGSESTARFSNALTTNDHGVNGYYAYGGSKNDGSNNYWWNKLTYDLNYERSKTVSMFNLLNRDNGWGATHMEGEYSLEGSQTPAELVWKINSGDSNTLADDAKIYLYIDDINVSAKYDELDSLKSDKTVFYNGVDKDSELAGAVIYGKSYTATPTKGANSFVVSDVIELDNNADRVSAQFSGLSTTENKAKIIVARYTEDTNGTKKLTNATVSDVTVENGVATADKYMDLTSGEGEIVQAYIWDGFDKITPLANLQKANYAQSGSVVFSTDFENDDTVQMFPGDNSSNRCAVGTDEALLGKKSLKVKCNSKNDTTDMKNRVRITNNSGSTLDSSFWSDYKKASGKYKVSLNVKATKDMLLGVWLDSSQRNGVNWNQVYNIIGNVPVKADDNWQNIVIYTDFGSYTEQANGSDALKGLKDSVVIAVTTDEAQDVYFDDITIEKMN